MELFIKGNVVIAQDMSQSVTTNTDITVLKDSNLSINRHFTERLINIDKGMGNMNSSLKLIRNDLHRANENIYSQILNEKEDIRNSLYSEHMKKLILDNYDAASNTGLIRHINTMVNPSYSPMISIHKKKYENEQGYVSDIFYKPKNDVKLICENKDGSRCYGVNNKAILFTLDKEDRIIYCRDIMEDELIEDDENGNYSTTISVYKKVLSNKDGSMESINVECCSDYEWIEVRRELYQLPDSLKDFNMIFLIPGMTSRGLYKFSKIDYSCGSGDAQDYINTEYDYRIYEKDRVIMSQNYRTWTFYKFFDNITDAEKWKTEVAKGYIVNNQQQHRYPDYELPKEVEMEHVYKSSYVNIIIKDGDNFIMDKYINQNTNRYGGGFYNIKNPELYRALSSNLEPLVDNVILKDERVIYNTKNKTAIEEDAVSYKTYGINKSPYNTFIYEAQLKYAKIILEGKINYVLQTAKIGEWAYQISSPYRRPENDNNQFTPPWTKTNKQEPINKPESYMPTVMVWRTKSVNGCAIGLAEINKDNRRTPIGELTFSQPSLNIQSNLFKDIEFSKIEHYWQIPSREFIPDAINGDRDSFSRYGLRQNESALWEDNYSWSNNTMPIKQRPKMLLDSFINSKQQSVIDINNVENYRYTNEPFHRINMEQADKACGSEVFVLILDHILISNGIKFKLEVRHKFMYHPHKMDIEALEYINSDLNSIRYEIYIDTKNEVKLRDIVDGVASNQFILGGVVGILDKTLGEIETLVNSYLNKLSKNTSQDEEATLFGTDSEMKKLLFVLSAFTNIIA